MPDNLEAFLMLRREEQMMGRKCHIIDFQRVKPDVRVLTYSVEPYSLKDTDGRKEISVPQTRVAISTKKRTRIGSFIIKTGR